MTEPEQPQIYLISPPAFELTVFPDMLARVLDTHPVACFRLALATQNEDKIARAADICREVTHARDVAIVVNDTIALSERLGLDGVHLSGAQAQVRAARKALGPDAIVGCFCGNSRHRGMEAGEAGADYVAFGPLSGSGDAADIDLFGWWTEVMEVPVVAEGGLDLSDAAALGPVTDFVGLGEELWDAETPAEMLGLYIEQFRTAHEAAER